MNQEFRGSVQKELIDQKGSFYSKYTTLILGKKGFFSFLKYEVVVLLFSGLPGALGFFLRKVFYPRLFKKVGKGVIFGRGITLRHPKKIIIGDNTFIDDNVVLDAKGEENEGILVGSNAFIGRNTILSCKEGSIYLDDFCNVSAKGSTFSWPGSAIWWPAGTTVLRIQPFRSCSNSPTQREG